MSGDIPVLDLGDLDEGARAWFERLVASGTMSLRRGEETIGVVSFSPSLLAGTVVSESISGDGTPADPSPDGVKVLATTMKLRPEARERLRDSLGAEWVVLDFHDAPDTADVVLTAPHSPQLIHRWTLLFPRAQIIVTEILDSELGLDVSGPVGRLMDAGAHVYLPPRPLEEVGQNVRGYLDGRARAEVGPPVPPIHQLGS
jgi:hypothetical protein